MRGHFGGAGVRVGEVGGFEGGVEVGEGGARVPFDAFEDAQAGPSMPYSLVSVIPASAASARSSLLVWK
ncbi:hypothetical protein ABZ565_29245 [Streptomyces sp. NPDC016469]|uniref:hypothetical protein n=1 Tax=Streptomyces sp. NPDC016469 TaxID=3157191 RepID=UPI0033EDB759